MIEVPEFKDNSLLNLARTHRSYVNERLEAGEEHNERLEFLGDAILGFLSGEFLYRRHPEMGEDELTRRRAAFVDEKQLAWFARKLRIGALMRLGRGAELDGGRENDSLLSSTFEAIVGAYYLDSGIEAVREFVEPLFKSVPENVVVTRSTIDFKNRFQEWVQASIGPVQPKYEMIKRSGPDHAPEFTVEVQVQGKVYGVGKGRSKKEAEKRAAEEALKDLGEL